MTQKCYPPLPNLSWYIMLANLNTKSHTEIFLQEVEKERACRSWRKPAFKLQAWGLKPINSLEQPTHSHSHNHSIRQSTDLTCSPSHKDPTAGSPERDPQDIHKYIETSTSWFCQRKSRLRVRRIHTLRVQISCPSIKQQRYFNLGTKWWTNRTYRCCQHG